MRSYENVKLKLWQAASLQIHGVIMKYLISFNGTKKGESFPRQHNVATEVPKAMESAPDEALVAFAQMIIVGTRAYDGATNILIEED